MRPDGSLAMVDVGAKPATARTATARAVVRLPGEAATALRETLLLKGDALVSAQLAGIMAAKETASLIPLAHPIPLSSVDVTFGWNDEQHLTIEATAKTVAATGVELEAMMAATIAALTIYDMSKGLERGIEIERISLVHKSGGRSGEWNAPSSI